MLKIFYFLLIERFLSYRVAFRTTTARSIAIGCRIYLPDALECVENIPYLWPFVQRFTIEHGRFGAGLFRRVVYLCFLSQAGCGVNVQIS